MIACRPVDIFEILAHNLPKGQRCVPISGSLSVEFSQCTNPINLRTVGVVAIKCCLIFISKIGDYTTSNRYSHTEYIDEDEELVLHHISECDEEEIFEHTNVIRDRTKTLNDAPGFHPGCKIMSQTLK